MLGGCGFHPWYHSWVKDPALLQAAVWSAEAARIGRWRGLTPSPEISICPRYSCKKKGKNKKNKIRERYFYFSLLQSHLNIRSQFSERVTNEIKTDKVSEPSINEGVASD